MAVQTTLLQSGNREVSRKILDQIMTVTAFIDTTVNALTALDVYRLFYYAANTYIKSCVVIVQTVEGTGDTMDVYDDESLTTALVTNNDMNSAVAGTKYETGFFKTSAGYISLRPDQALTVCKFWVIAEYITVKTTD